MQSSDPDALQLLDETNKAWVKKWCKVTKKPSGKMSFYIAEPDKLEAKTRLAKPRQ